MPSGTTWVPAIAWTQNGPFSPGASRAGPQRPEPRIDPQPYPSHRLLRHAGLPVWSPDDPCTQETVAGADESPMNTCGFMHSDVLGDPLGPKGRGACVKMCESKNTQQPGLCFRALLTGRGAEQLELTRT